jgi:hypothetical protein
MACEAVCCCSLSRQAARYHSRVATFFLTLISSNVLVTVKSANMRDVFYILHYDMGRFALGFGSFCEVCRKKAAIKLKLDTIVGVLLIRWKPPFLYQAGFPI